MGVVQLSPLLPSSVLWVSLPDTGGFTDSGSFLQSCEFHLVWTFWHRLFVWWEWWISILLSTCEQHGKLEKIMLWKRRLECSFLNIWRYWITCAYASGLNKWVNCQLPKCLLFSYNTKYNDCGWLRNVRDHRSGLLRTVCLQTI